MKVRIVGSKKDFIKYPSRPTFIGYKKIRKDYYIIYEKQLSIKLDKPVYVGCAVLELSKLALYKFWYDIIMKQCDDPKLLYIDTDSFSFESKENFRDIMLENKEFYDLSNQPRDPKYYCPDNKKVPGKMKDEYAGQTITEFIALKPMSYTIITKKSEKCTHKGHSANFENKEYKDALVNKKVIENEKNNI